MPETVRCLLQELEDVSGKALEQACAGDLTGAGASVRERGLALNRLQDVLAADCPVSYEEWNRLTVIHFQGNRIEEALVQARLRLLAERVERTRERALLHCVSGVVKRRPRASLNEVG